MLGEEEIADVSLTTFHVFDKENLGSGILMARACGGCRGCGGRGCAGCRGCRGCAGCRACRGCGCGVGVWGGCCASWGGCRWC
jgi:hypothetical protein